MKRAAGFFPLFIPLDGKCVMVIGGGNVAFRRVQTLLTFDCRFHIIAGTLCDRIEETAVTAGERFRIERRAFAAGDIVNGDRPVFVIAATDKRAVNHAVALECRAQGIPVSVADCKEESTFYFPAIVTHEVIVAGVSSGGSDHGAVRDAAAAIREALK